MGEARLVIGLARSRASTKIRNPKSEMRKKSEARNPKSERSPKLEIRDPQEEIRNPKSEIRKKSEARNPKSERSPKLEIRKPKEVRSPKPEKKARIRWLLVCLDLPTASGCPIREFGIRNSKLGFLSDFGFRISDFIGSLSPDRAENQIEFLGFAPKPASFLCQALFSRA